jgi:hypothetical protein
LTVAAFSAFVAASSRTCLHLRGQDLDLLAEFVLLLLGRADAATISGVGCTGASAFAFSASTAARVACSSASSDRPSRERNALRSVDTRSSFGSVGYLLRLGGRENRGRADSRRG